MNWYFYWHYTIYNIFKKLSKRESYEMEATSLFSVFLFMLMIGILSLVFILLGKPKILFSNSFLFIMFIIVIFVINYIIFIPKKKQIKRYHIYKENQTKIKDCIFIIVSLLSIVIFIISIIQVRRF